ncbi:MAG: two-component regulator propeller domain-containing protein [Saprospiraceae bacterium]|nr:two-component regulator propeller domain-containing protein [Saprospiraceae bacterium]
MIKQLKYFAISILITFNFSCKGQVGTKAQDEDLGLDERNNSGISSYEYGAGDVVFRGYLDRLGNMWFATSKEGIFIYDGTSFTNISEKDGLCSNMVNAIVEDKDGVMWFGTNRGLCSYDGNNFDIISLPKEDSIKVSPKTGLPSRKTQTILSLIQSKNGDFWIGTDAAGAYRFNGKSFTSYLKFEGRIQPEDNVYNNCITTIIEDKNGHIWIGSFTHGGLNEFDGTNMIHHPLKDGYGDGMISTSYKDKKGNLWFGTRNGGIYKYDYKTFENISDSKTGEQIAMASVVEDSNEKIWVGSFARKGFYRYTDGSFVPLNSMGGEKLNDIKFISEDKKGNIWIGGRYGLLWRFDGEKLTDFTQKKRMK